MMDPDTQIMVDICMSATVNTYGFFRHRRHFSAKSLKGETIEKKSFGAGPSGRTHLLLLMR